MAGPFRVSASAHAAINAASRVARKFSVGSSSNGAGATAYCGSGIDGAASTQGGGRCAGLVTKCYKSVTMVVCAAFVPERPYIMS